MKLYRSFRQEVPEGEYTIPIGKADIKREGTDVSVITYGAMVHESLKAASELEKEGISVEVVDLRTVQPLDIETIIASVEKQAAQSLYKKRKNKQVLRQTLLQKLTNVRFLALKRQYCA